MKSSRGRATSACRQWVALLLTLALSGGVAASPSTHFDPVIQVEGKPLMLNGAGTRYKAIFKIYDVALYTQGKVRSTAELLALPGPKRLQFVAMRDLPSAEIGRLFVRAMTENSPPDVVELQAVSVARLIEVFSSVPKLVSGEPFAMEFIPGKGTTFEIDGKAQGAPVGDADFFAMVMKIWFGDSPADPMLKDALLGIPIRTSDSR
jgi:Chalcone isomerase-like